MACPVHSILASKLAHGYLADRTGVILSVENHAEARCPHMGRRVARMNSRDVKQESFSENPQAVRRDAYSIRRPLCTSTGEPSAIKAESGARPRISAKPDP